MNDPELGIERALTTYLSKGYPEKWVNQRVKSIEVRNNLTEERRRVGLEESIDYGILTNEITKAWS